VATRRFTTRRRPFAGSRRAPLPQDRSSAPGSIGTRFAVSFKGVLLEGLEVVFIVLSFGSAQGRLGLAAGGAGAAVVLVVVAGVVARGPLERVPENTIKFAVGLLLSSFGCFWAAEGVGIHWRGDELSLLGVIAFFSPVSYVLVRALQRQRLALVAKGAEA
jgi:uncharacterized membrane protein